MDFAYILLLMALLYLLPELLRRRKPKQYEYPDIPERVPQPQAVKKEQRAQPEIRRPAAAAPSLVMPDPVHVPVTKDESPWQGQINVGVIQNGYIFSEVIQPPRAYRPLIHHRFPRTTNKRDK